MATETNYPKSLFFGAWAKIYSLSDSQGNVFYVGCTRRRLEERLAQHINEAKADKPSVKNRRLRHIANLRFHVTATIIDMLWVTGKTERELLKPAQIREKEWIERYYQLGYPLLNGKATPISKVEALSAEVIGKTVQATPTFDNLNNASRVVIGEPVTSQG